jgi:hypothetical protein
MKLCKLPVAALLFLLMESLSAQQSDVSGKWKWEDASGGQSIVLELKSAGGGISGTITMAQAALKLDADAKSDYYLNPENATNNMRALFFPPVTFRITDGKITGNTISFTQVSHNAAQGNGFGGAPGVFGGFGQRGPAGGGMEKLFYTGKIDGDTIQFTRESRPNPGGHLVVGTHAVTFSVTRVR